MGSSLKGNGYTLRGSNSYFHFAFNLIRSELSKEFAPLKFFALRVASILKGYIVQESKQEVTKVVSLCNYDRNS